MIPPRLTHSQQYSPTDIDRQTGSVYCAEIYWGKYIAKCNGILPVLEKIGTGKKQLKIPDLLELVFSRIAGNL